MKNKLSSYQTSVIHGLMLGDGHIAVNKNIGDPTYKYTQTFGQFAEPFANCVYDIFREYCSDKGLYTYKVQSGKDSPFYQRWIVRTKTHDVFDEFDTMYYIYNKLGKRIKIVPLDIEDYLTPVALAFLVMSDGCFIKTKHIIKISTNSFTKAEVQLLGNAIFNNFGIEMTVTRARKEEYLLIVRKSQVTKFQQIVKAYMIPSLIYRIGL